MQVTQILTLVGAGIGVGMIILGIVAISTSTWIVLTAPQTLEATYGLFDRCNKALIAAAAPLAGCKTLEGFHTAQGLLISGVIIAGLGIIASTLLGILVDNRWIKLLPPVLLIVGPTLILIGAVFYVKNVLGNFSAGTSKLDLGYSFILVMVTCILGYVSAAYFLFVAGIAHGHQREQFLVSPVIHN